MADDIQVKRTYVSDMYPGKNWKIKVSHMSDIQVIAIYLKAKKAEGNQPKPKKESDDEIPF